jgi:catechol 2,3-dioxygenase-like lactoylglutathione lyase family enzyme
MRVPFADGIAQVCYVVRDLDRALKMWTEVYRAGPFYVADFRLDEGQRYRGKPTALDVRIAVGYSGSLNIELLQPRRPGPSIFHEILDTRGEGIHHFWMRCANLDAEIARFEARGCPVVAGGEVAGFGRSYFVDTLSVLGVFTELQELHEAVWVVLEGMHQAHLNWDGKTDPVRPYPQLTAVD